MTNAKENKDISLQANRNENSRSAPGLEVGGLRGDCAGCFGLCCAALYFSASEGFPFDKEAGVPCTDLLPDFRCGVYERVRNRELRGCGSFDCFGAGQKVSRTTFGGKDWHKYTETRLLMFDVFKVMRQLHEMLWYLHEGLRFDAASPIYSDLNGMIDETEQITRLDPVSLMRLDVYAHRAKVNGLLVKTSQLVRANVKNKQQDTSMMRMSFRRGADLAGKDLRNYDLRGANLRGACLIAADLRETDLSGADLIGADFRDTDVRGADLSQSLFLTQVQINQARGDSGTKLPESIDRPSHWM